MEGRRWGQHKEHPSSAEISPFRRTGCVIPEDSGWKVLPSICGAQRNPCAMGRVSLDLVSHTPAHYQSTGTSCFLSTEIYNKKLSCIKTNMMEIMQNSPPPTSSCKVKFHANAILLLFNYQPAPGRWGSQDRFPFVRLHKAREAGVWGLHGLGENCSLGSTC